GLRPGSRHPSESFVVESGIDGRTPLESNHSVDIDWGRDVLEGNRPKFLDRDIHLVFDLVSDRPGDADAAWLGQRFDPGCNVYPVTHQIVPLREDVTDVNADAEVSPVYGIPLRVPLCHRGLNFHRALQ